MVELLLEVGDDPLNYLQGDKNLVSPLTGQPLTYYQTVKSNNHYKPSGFLRHQDQINAVMMAIKPGFFNIYFKKYDKEMVLQYL